MIDTIVLLFRSHMFTIIDHSKFSPSTHGLYDKINPYRLGGRSNMKCQQNPTKSELINGIYKPRLTVTKRINKFSQFELTLKVELSIPKLLFGNNFDEVDETDFIKVLPILKKKLNDMGVLIFEKCIPIATVSAIHFSKNIALTDFSTPFTYLKEISKCNINQRLDLNQTDFRNEGHSLKFRANSFEIAFYDKLKDLNKAKISEKRTEEKDNIIQLNLFQTKSIKKPFEVLRIEARLNKRQKIKQILNKIGLDIEPNFQNLFKKDISQKVLLYYLKEIETGYPSLLSYDFQDPEKFISNFIVNNPKAGLRKTIQMFGQRVLLDKFGIRGFREIVKKFGSNNWYRLNNEMTKLNYPKKISVFAPLYKALTEFKSLKLVDFQSEMINNDNIS